MTIFLFIIAVIAIFGSFILDDAGKPWASFTVCIIALGLLMWSGLMAGNG